jgi:hypothetical protein
MPHVRHIAFTGLRRVSGPEVFAPPMAEPPDPAWRAPGRSRRAIQS